MHQTVTGPHIKLEIIMLTVSLRLLTVICDHQAPFQTAIRVLVRGHWLRCSTSQLKTTQFYYGVSLLPIVLAEIWPLYVGGLSYSAIKNEREVTD